MARGANSRGRRVRLGFPVAVLAREADSQLFQLAVQVGALETHRLGDARDVAPLPRDVVGSSISIVFLILDPAAGGIVDATNTATTRFVR